MKLDIGCGRSPKPGYVGVDIEEVVKPDIVAPMWNIPIGDGEVDAIFSTHALEHVGKHDVVRTLKEWARLLKPHGKIEVQVPDLEWCVRTWLEKGMPNDWHLDTIFGNQEHAGEFHRTGFTKAIMENYVAHAGLKVDKFSITLSHGQPTMIFILSKE